MVRLLVILLAVSGIGKVIGMAGRRNKNRRSLISGLVTFGLIAMLFSRGGFISMFLVLFLAAVLGISVAVLVKIFGTKLDLTTHNRKTPYQYGENNSREEEPQVVYEEQPQVVYEEKPAEKKSHVTVTLDENPQVTASDRFLAEIDAVPMTDDKVANDVITKGKEMLRQICSENEAIPDKDLSWKMDETVKTCIRILNTISEKPGKAAQARKFMNYYLPTTVKILASYRKISSSGVSRSDIDYARVEAGRCLDMVITACQKQLDSLYQETKLDMSTDIDVLEQMMKRDGYMDSDITVGSVPPKSAGTAASAQMEIHEAPILHVETTKDSGDYQKKTSEMK